MLCWLRFLFGYPNFFRRIYCGKNSAADSASCNFFSRYSADKNSAANSDIRRRLVGLSWCNLIVSAYHVLSDHVWRSYCRHSSSSLCDLILNHFICRSLDIMNTIMILLYITKSDNVTYCVTVYGSMSNKSLQFLCILYTFLPSIVWWNKYELSG